MRLIGKFDDEGLARTFSRQLSSLKIDNQIAMEPDGTCEIWVIWEDEVKRAEQLLSQFQFPSYKIENQPIPKQIEKLQEPKENKNQKKDTVTTGRFIGHVTLFFIIISVIVSFFSGLGRNMPFLQKFFITDIVNDGGFIQWHKGLAEIANGEYWKLITPIFIHFGFAHLVFNMLWLYTLGNMVEEQRGSWLLGIFITIAAIGSNLTQYFVFGPYFGGMSGVLYGLLGYCLMKSKFDSGSKIYLGRPTVYTMIAWYVFSFTGLLGPMANGAHTAGLLIGFAWGYLSSKSRPTKENL